jgi:hypothetical protein
MMHHAIRSLAAKVRSVRLDALEAIGSPRPRHTLAAAATPRAATGPLPSSFGPPTGPVARAPMGRTDKSPDRCRNGRAGYVLLDRRAPGIL